MIGEDQHLELQSRPRLDDGYAEVDCCTIRVDFWVFRRKQKRSGFYVHAFIDKQTLNVPLRTAPLAKLWQMTLAPANRAKAYLKRL